MHITAHLDVDVIAVETEDEVSVLLELTAPDTTTDATATRPVRSLQIVLDRSGSMSGDPIEGAKTALAALVDRLDPTDNFGLVAFDNHTELVVPAGPLADKRKVKRAIASIGPGGPTDLSGGYLRGVQEARRVAGPTGATLLLISDGHANVGIVEPGAFGGIASEAHSHRITTSALGWGLGYDERIMSAVARGGSGNELYAENSDAAVALIAGEVDGLLAQTAQAASLLIRRSEHITAARVLNELPTTDTTDGVMAELGSFYSGETRRLVLTFSVPALAALGVVEVATLELTYVELPALKQHTITVPLHVNVVPGDQAAGRVPDPTVQTETVFQRVQQAKRRASGHLSAGDSEAALAEIAAAQQLVQGQLGADVPSGLQADLTEEAETLRYLAEQTELGSISHAAKYSSMTTAQRSRYLGRRPSSGSSTKEKGQ